MQQDAKPQCGGKKNLDLTGTQYLVTHMWRSCIVAWMAVRPNWKRSSTQQASRYTAKFSLCLVISSAMAWRHTTLINLGTRQRWYKTACCTWGSYMTSQLQGVFEYYTLRTILGPTNRKQWKKWKNYTTPSIEMSTLNIPCVIYVKDEMLWTSGMYRGNNHTF
jgi:hypothetical protein